MMRDLVLGVVLAALFFLCVVGGAFAHSWYPWECCSDQDCAPIKLNETPKEGNGGFTLMDGSGRFVAYKDIKPSPDGQWHLCEQKWPDKLADRKILCVWAPIGGV